MSTVFNTLKSACPNEDVKVYKNFDQLSIGEYNIREFNLVETKFGLRLLAISDEFYIYLPARFSKKINEQHQIDELNKGRCTMLYNGKDKNGVLLDFKQDDEKDSGYEEEIEKELERKVKTRKCDQFENEIVAKKPKKQLKDTNH